MKRWISGGLALLLTAMLLVFVGCGADEHEHASNMWEANLEEHWMLDTDGARVHVEKHTMEGNFCTACAAQITTNDKGETNLFLYSATGLTRLYRCYDADGNVTIEQTYTYVFDQNGGVKGKSTHSEGQLIREEYYQLDAERKTYVAKRVEHLADDKTLVNVYHPDGTLYTSTFCDKDGKTISEDRYAYTYDEDGVMTNQKIYKNDVLIREYRYTVDHGHAHLTLEITYDENGEVLEEIEHEIDPDHTHG